MIFKKKLPESLIVLASALLGLAISLLTQGASREVGLIATRRERILVILNHQGTVVMAESALQNSSRSEIK